MASVFLIALKCLSSTENPDRSHGDGARTYIPSRKVYLIRNSSLIFLNDDDRDEAF
jgi:hypothetical protein